MAKILLQRYADGKDISIEDDLIISAYTKDSITTIEYLAEEDGYRKTVQVEQTLTNIGNLSEKLISLTIKTSDAQSDSGVSDASTTANLTDATQDFDVTCAVGDRVHNTTADTWATVLVVTSATALALDEDIFDGTGSENYIVYSKAGETVWVNEFRINQIDERYKLATIYVDAAGSSPKAIKLSTNAATVKTAVITKHNDYSLAIGSYTSAPKTIVLTSASGDLTANFTSGAVFSVYGENTSNDGVYSVVSSAYGSGVTTITVNETLTTATSYGGLVWLRGTSTSAPTGGGIFTAPIIYSNATGITAGTTQTQGGATALVEEINNVTTCTTAGDGVKLPTAAGGLRVTVKNSGATILAVYPFSGDSIDALAANLSVGLLPGSTGVFFAISSTVWESNIDNSMTLNAPTTASGQLEFKAANSAGNTITTVTNASQAAARTYTIPDAGANASFCMTEGAETINGIKTHTSPLTATVSGGTKGLAIIGTVQSANDLCTIAGATAVTSAALMKAVDVTYVTSGVSAVNMIEVARYTLTSAVQNGNWANAVVGKIDFTTTGYVTGLAGVFCAELDMPTTSPAGGAGTYTCYEAEINMAGASGGVPISAMCVNVWGAQATDFDTNGLLLDVTGVVVGVAGSTKFFSANTVLAATHSLKVRVNGGVYYMLLNSATS